MSCYTFNLQSGKFPYWRLSLIKIDGFNILRIPLYRSYFETTIPAIGRRIFVSSIWVWSNLENRCKYWYWQQFTDRLLICMSRFRRLHILENYCTVGWKGSWPVIPIGSDTLKERRKKGSNSKLTLIYGIKDVISILIWLFFTVWIFYIF